MIDCLFCRIAAGDVPCRQIWADEDAIAFLDISPWQLGHTLVIPRRHVADGGAGAQPWHEVAAALAGTAALLKERLNADGLNILSNAGAVSGQEVFHFHVHVIPRYADNPGMAGLMLRDPAAAADLDALAARLAVRPES
ncbi:MAG: HIT domain-containing protein [Propionibacteriaceae bacterium]|jgi:histidine triad (HIT) family protein|nr:HIT domain-containing protein [Propionibacteriaceae bacterium]